MYQYDLSETKWNGKVKSFYPIYEFNFGSLAESGQNQNFSRIRVEGELHKRVCAIETFNSSGDLLFRKRIHEHELKF